MTKTEGKPAVSPEDLLKAAVTGKPEPAAAPAGAVSGTIAGLSARARREARLLGAAGAALAVGAMLGAGVTVLSSPGRMSGDAVSALGTTLDANRIETARLGGEVARLQQALSDLRTATESARKEAAARDAALGERFAQFDKTVTGKVTALGERFEQAEREQGTRIAALATQFDRRPVATAAPVAKAEPAQTGSLAEAKVPEAKVPETKSLEAKSPEAKVADAKPKPEPKPAAPEKPPIIDGWALRDVYNGTAILENRRRRLVEVAAGDTLPGIGRVESVERHGREWVVVTRQGLVTPQPW